MYQEGLGVTASVDEAANWYTKAIEDKFPSARMALRNLKR
jgi:TPR repeat protein